MELLSTPTNIDRSKCTRTVPMECLVLGLGRTGTKSVCTALEILGFDHVYHMDSALNNPQDNDLWLRALATKYPDHPLNRGYEQGFGREEWDQLLGHCQVGIRIQYCICLYGCRSPGIMLINGICYTGRD